MRKPYLDIPNNCYVAEDGTKYPFSGSAAHKRLQYLLACAGCRPLKKFFVQSKIVIRRRDGEFVAELPWDATADYVRGVSEILNKPPKEPNEPNIN